MHHILRLHLDSHACTAAGEAGALGGGGDGALLRGAALASRWRGERVHAGRQPLPLGRKSVRTAPSLAERACTSILVVEGRQPDLVSSHPRPLMLRRSRRESCTQPIVAHHEALARQILVAAKHGAALVLRSVCNEVVEVAPALRSVWC